MKSGKFKFLSLYFTITLMIFAVFGIFSAAKVNAQSSSSSILVDVVPPNPIPYEDVSITLSSYANNLDSVLITWSVDGKTVLSGIGKKSYTLKAGAAGSAAAVLATISLPDGDVETRLTLRPSIMVLLSQANDSYVPPFYRGKALPTAGSEVKVVAMPEVRTSSGLIDSKNMTYAWRKDYTNDQESSGYGKNFFTYVNDYLEGSNNISVTASTVDQNYSSDASINIGAAQPKILFYKNDAIAGTTWEKALPDPYKIQRAEIVEAIPYFISPKEIQNPMLIWSWFINDSQVNNQGFRKNLMPLQVQSGTSGTSRLKLQIDNQFKIFQTASKEINIEF